MFLPGAVKQLGIEQHPLFLLAKARLDSQEKEKEKLFLKFAQLFPDAVDKWMTETEKVDFLKRKTLIDGQGNKLSNVKGT